MPSGQPDDLGERIARAQAERSAKQAARRRRQASDEGSTSAGAYALRFGTEFVASVFVGGFLGYWIDEAAGTAPWGLLVMGSLGLAAGIRAIMRAYRQLSVQAQQKTQERPAPDDRTDD
jgi:ATP synthase protein I